MVDTASVDGAPDLAAIKSWLGPAASSVPEDELRLMLDAALVAQAENHDVPDPMPTPLVEAILRRVAKSVASKAHPLGMLIGGEYEYEGPATVRRWDSEISERENRYYIHAIA